MPQSSVLRPFPFSPLTLVSCSPLFFPSLSKYASLWISSTSQDFTYHLFFVASQKITSLNIKPICQILVQSWPSTDHPSSLQAVILQSICYVPSIAVRMPLSQSFSISGTPFCQFQVQFFWCSSLLCVSLTHIQAISISFGPDIQCHQNQITSPFLYNYHCQKFIKKRK